MYTMTMNMRRLIHDLFNLQSKLANLDLSLHLLSMGPGIELLIWPGNKTTQNQIVYLALALAYQLIKLKQ
jgi:fermentation-respiration switch protein FrsA (DUF1100 family)